ncbi:hypothetical protein F4805DRAFT_413016 [Annulohypoxylon moriforme]|nr:hypothetical protein F4805DRAFT_413016 [Annulohypoxylon moriforme]
MRCSARCLTSIALEVFLRWLAAHGPFCTAFGLGPGPMIFMITADESYQVRVSMTPSFLVCLPFILYTLLKSNEAYIVDPGVLVSRVQSQTFISADLHG